VSYLLAARWFVLANERERALTLYEQAVARMGTGEAQRRADVEWEKRLVAGFGGTRTELAREALELVRGFPASGGIVEAASVVVLRSEASERERREVADILLARATEEPRLFNRQVYLFLAAGMLDEALRAAREQVARSPGDANARDTLAEVYHYRRDKGAAISSAAEALQRARSRRMRQAYSQNLRRFEADSFIASPDVNAVKQGHREFLERHELREP
jgi:tetratricopeptide (TPR) repeat protein